MEERRPGQKPDAEERPRHKAYMNRQRRRHSRSVRRKKHRSLTLKSVRSKTARRHSQPAMAIIKVKQEIDLRRQDSRAKKKADPRGADLIEF